MAKTPFGNPFNRKPTDPPDRMRNKIESLERSVQELTVLSELAFAMGAESDPDDIVKALVDRVMRGVEAEQAVVTLTERDEGKTDLMHTNLRVKVTSSEGPAYHFSDALLGWMHINKKALVVNDPATDERFKRVEFDPSIRSLLCVPLMMRNALTGVITVYNKKGDGGFSAMDERLVAIIGAQSATVIENARLAKESVLVAQMRRDQENAAQIQRNLLPSSNPDIGGYDIAGASIPAQSVGGDYYDFITTPGGFAVCLGDVSGKGIPASLLMANLQATLRNSYAGGAIPVDECIIRANAHLVASTDPERFVTLFYSELDPSTHSVTYCSAGHDPAMLFAGGELRRIDACGPALGVLDTFPYIAETVTLAPGDTLVMYSDGMTDATNVHDLMFSDEQLVDSVRKHYDLPAAKMVEAVMQDVQAFAGDAPQFDDLTMVVLRRV